VSYINNWVVYINYYGENQVYKDAKWD
jgi:hypothetical protein